MRLGPAPRPRWPLALLVVVAACPVLSGASVVEMGPEFHTVTTEVATPHVAWAKPLASGAARALVIAPRFAHRETAELMQRLDIQCDVVMTHSYKGLGGDTGIVGMREDEILDSLRDQLGRPHDVIIVGNLHWALIPKPLQYEILRQVSEGTGLLLVAYSEDTPSLFTRLFTPLDLPELLLSGVPWGALPSLPADPSSLLRFCGTLKRGRCLVLRWATGSGGFHCLTAEPKEQLEYDYDMSIISRAVLWLADREPDATIELRPPQGDARTLGITLSGELSDRVLAAVVRDAYNEVELETTVDVRDSRAELELPPALKGGRHFVDVWLRESPGGPVVTWASTYFDLERDGAIASVRTERQHYAKGETVRVVVDFASNVDGPAELLISAEDIHGRVWARATQPVEPGAKSAAVEFPAIGMLSTFSRLRVDLVRDGRPIQRASGELYVPLREREDFSLGAWGGGGSSWLSHCRWKWAYELGLRTAIFDGDIAAGVRGTPYSTGDFRHGGKGDVRDPCLTDPAFWEKGREHLTERARSRTHADIFAYSLGDEICLDVGNTSLCRSPTCLAGLREHLKREYATLDALNLEWGADFADWEQVRPQSRKQADASANLAPWLDHRLFMDRVFTQGLARARDIIHETDPDVPVGAEGLWGSASPLGMDWWPMSRELDYLVPYWRGKVMVESIRSFRRPGTITGTWFGNYGEQGIDEEMLRWFPWNVLLNGCSSIWWYTEFRAVQFGGAATGFAPDYRPTRGFRAALEEIAEIRSGPATLLPRLQRKHDGIAILYSRPSLHVWGAGHANELLTALEDLGYQYNMVPAAELSAGRLQEGGCRLLILPGVCVMSDDGAAEVTEFVRQGGSLLAVLPPAVYDEHGRPRAESPLAELFGVTGVGPDLVNEVREVMPSTGDAFNVAQVSTLAASEATPLATFADGSPAALAHGFGSGGTALVNFSFKGFSDARVLDDGELPLRAFLGAVLRDLGVSPQVNVTSDRPVRGLEIATFTDGTNEYIAMTLEPLGPLRRRRHDRRRLRLEFSDSRLTYDVRTHENLGIVDGLDLSLRPGDARLLARLARDPSAPTIEVAPASLPPGRDVRVSLRAGGGHPRVLRLTVVGPDGRALDWWAQNVFVEADATAVRLDVALNARPGSYALSAQDIVTGRQAKTRFEVTDG